MFNDTLTEFTANDTAHEGGDGAAAVIEALDSAWQDYLTQFGQWSAASAQASRRVGDAIGSAERVGCISGLWEVEFEPGKVWAALAREMGNYARRKLTPPGLSVELEDSVLQSMGHDRYSRYDGLAEHEATLRALSLRTVWDRYVDALDPTAARRKAAEQASRNLRRAFWRHVPRRHGRDQEPVGQAGGRYVLTASCSRDHYAKGYCLSYSGGEEIHRTAQAIASICALEGEPRMGLAIERGAAAAIHSLRHGFASRERVQISGEAFLVMFKDHLQWHLTPELWTVLQAGADWKDPE